MAPNQTRFIPNDEPKPSVIKQQMFGPWTTYDRRIQQQVVRTHATSGTTQRRFTSTAPPAPFISAGKTATVNGWQFSIRISGGTTTGYRVYTGNVNNSAVASLLDYKSQPPIVHQGETIQFQYVTTGSPFYWVAAVNNAGQESNRILVGGTAAPVPNPSQPSPSGGGSGSGSGGGKGTGIPFWKVGG